MKEIIFLQKNQPSWEIVEKFVKGEVNLSPDELKSAYTNLVEALSYSRTFYPDSKTSLYLNNLALKVHTKIYSKKRFDFENIKRYWVYELPLLIYQSRKEFLISFLIFFVAVMIGIISTKYDDSFVRIILGDDYVNMTLRNIEKGDPLAVYKKANQLDMFLGITFNNIMVSFNAFAFGLMTPLGTGIILFKNGVMLGSFQQFFAGQGLFYDYLKTVWIHGTFEISAIIIAGAAGIILGNSFLFPGTYSRSISFKMGALRGVRIILALIPIFIIAGFLEGFVTRLTEMPDVINFLIIILSLSFMIWYFVIYPIKIYKRSTDVELITD
ncbi:MAG: stage II sporulation protein M [Candidatus Kapabacteria bacterium]|nr:stage II sporulation protein M [Ignavibacteriota bacterium]MCW5886112.1 stage II sporulation protein M [Candidatus Kapabacteria bacterium]